MSRSGWALLGLWLAGCAVGSGRPAETPDLSVRTAFVLTATLPERVVPVGPLATAPSLLRLTLSRIDNPAQQGLALSAMLTSNAGPDGGEVFALGMIAPFPADQPGSFVLPVSEAARGLLLRREGAQLRMTLLPVVAGRPLRDPLQVTVLEPTWSD